MRLKCVLGSGLLGLGGLLPAPLLWATEAPAQLAQVHALPSRRSNWLAR